LELQLDYLRHLVLDFLWRGAGIAGRHYRGIYLEQGIFELSV
jgi:hypothetical protein